MGGTCLCEEVGKFQPWGESVKVRSGNQRICFGNSCRTMVVALFPPHMGPCALRQMALFFPARVPSFPKPCVLAGPIVIRGPSANKSKMLVVTRVGGPLCECPESCTWRIGAGMWPRPRRVLIYGKLFSSFC